NTAFLLAQGWRGCWVEGDPEASRAIREGQAAHLRDGVLHLLEMFVTRENIAAALNSVPVTGEVDLLSVDVDRNTYWVWEALAGVRARVVVVEYNATYPAWLDWKLDYEPDRWWDATFAYGASLKAFELLGRRLRY